MSFATRLWALLCCCSSLLCVSAAAPDELLTTAASVQAEIDLASRRELYLVLDPCHLRLHVRTRGWTLHTTELSDAALIAPAGLGQAPEPAVTSLPILLVVREAPVWREQQVVAPAELKPYDPEAESPLPPAPTPPPPPTSYVVQLEDGLVLRVDQTLPGRSLIGRATGAVLDGWRRLVRSPRTVAPGLAVALSDDEARRLFHLFQPGLPLLVTACRTPE